ncbi:predicted protein [Histoplasma capsulatum H143]|uniref:Secreted protein n=1 Tax=Ajellomyces capsulatus (strain H143) TaxID=544712 RepID=C6H9W5_AJECH|nr:predicted protein [Histoplasma capsulatum H143]
MTMKKLRLLRYLLTLLLALIWLARIPPSLTARQRCWRCPFWSLGAHNTPVPRSEAKQLTEKNVLLTRNISGQDEPRHNEGKRSFAHQYWRCYWKLRLELQVGWQLQRPILKRYHEA